MILISPCWLVSGILVVLSILWLWTKTRLPYKNVNIPPFPVQPWPILGHFFMLRSNFRDKMKECRRKTGGTYSLMFGRELHIFVNDFDMIKEMMNKHSDNIINIPQSLVNELTNEFNKGIVFARDDNWKEQRTTSLSILRLLGMGKEIMARKIELEVSFFIEQLADLEGHPADLSPLIHACVANVMFSISVGKRFQHTDPEFIAITESALGISKYLMPVVLLRPLKYLRYFPGDLFNVKKWTTAAKYSTDFIKSYIAESKQFSYESDEPTSFISAYLKEMNKMKEKGVASQLSEENLISLLRSFFVAGTESSGATILWCLLYMLYNPEVQEKIYREIESNVASTRLPTMADKSKLTYLNAVILETQRLASLVPVASRREVGEKFELNGFTFPKGSIILPVLDSVHDDKNIWGDPDNFRPERFIDINGALIHREELIPFGIGRRICVGEALARMEMFLFLSAMFQRFKFEPAHRSGQLPTLETSFAAVCKPKSFEIKAVPRQQ